MRPSHATHIPADFGHNRFTAFERHFEIDFLDLHCVRVATPQVHFDARRRLLTIHHSTDHQTDKQHEEVEAGRKRGQRRKQNIRD